MDIPRPLQELAKSLKELGLTGLEPVRMQAADADVPGLSGGVEETRRFGFIPPGKRRETQSVTLVIPKELRPAAFPRSGISILNQRGAKIGPDGGWAMVSDQEMEGNWVVNLSTD